MSVAPPVAGPALNSPLGHIYCLTADPAGNVFITDWSYLVIMKITPDGALSIVAGDGTYLPTQPGSPTSTSVGDPGASRCAVAGHDRESWGRYVLVVARFIPGGRTATTFTAGLVRLRWLTRFAPYVFVAAIFWAVYGALLGYVGGRLFKDQPIYALLLAFGVAALITVGGRGWRHLRKV